MRQCAKPIEILGSMHCASKARQKLPWIEIVQIQQSSDGFVVISAYEGLAEFARAGSHLSSGWRRNPQYLRGSQPCRTTERRRDWLQSFEIGVNVAEKKYAHEMPIIDCARRNTQSGFPRIF